MNCDAQNECIMWLVQVTKITMDNDVQNGW